VAVARVKEVIDLKPDSAAVTATAEGVPHRISDFRRSVRRNDVIAHKMDGGAD
jgi:hypothetical protein